MSDRYRSRSLAVGVAALAAVSSGVIAAQPGLATSAAPGIADVPQALATGTVAAPAPATVSAWTPPAGRPTLEYGDHGAAVLALQKRLASLRYDVGPVDGEFGYSTLHGVVAFQKVQRISRDGVVGPVTWAHLASPYRPKARYWTGTRAIEVNLHRQVVYLTREGTVRRILDSSTGSGQPYYSSGSWHIARTPVGRFHLTWRVDGWRHSVLGWMWRPNYFYGGYALHGSTSVPNYPASHGCVRVTIPAMNRLWPVLHVGMRLAVY